MEATHLDRPGRAPYGCRMRTLLIALLLALGACDSDVADTTTPPIVPDAPRDQGHTSWRFVHAKGLCNPAPDHPICSGPNCLLATECCTNFDAGDCLITECKAVDDGLWWLLSDSPDGCLDR